MTTTIVIVFVAVVQPAQEGVQRQDPLSVFDSATLRMRSNSEMMATSEIPTAASVLGRIVNVAVEGLQLSRISV